MNDELMVKRHELMQDVDGIVDDIFLQKFGDDDRYNDMRDEIVGSICNAICERID